MKTIKKLSSVLVAGGLILVSVLSVSAAEQKKEEVEVVFFNEAGASVRVTKEIEDSLKKQVVADRENVGTDEEPLANLEVIKDKETINKIVSENPRIQKYLDQNEVFAELEIMTDQNEIEKIWEKNPEIEKLMKSEEDYRLAHIKGNSACLRDTPSTSGQMIGLLDQNKKDWVLLNNNYSVNENYIWWQVSDSSTGSSGWIANDYIYLNANKNEERTADVPGIDFNTLKFIQ